MFSQAELSKYAEIFQAQGQVNGFLPGVFFRPYCRLILHLAKYSCSIIYRFDCQDHVLKLRTAGKQARENMVRAIVCVMSVSRRS